VIESIEVVPDRNVETYKIPKKRAYFTHGTTGKMSTISDFIICVTPVGKAKMTYTKKEEDIQAIIED
jgi:hypothetical protein